MSPKAIITASIILFSYLLAFAQPTGSFTDARDKRTYKTVTIGEQVWMAENLDVGKMITITDSSALQSDNGVIEKYCYGNKPGNCKIYGGLYTWDEMMSYQPSDSAETGTTQGICPKGWHLPTDKEWMKLVNYLGGLEMAGGKMKEVGTDHWKCVDDKNTKNTGASNESGFTALGCGYTSNGREVFTGIYQWNIYWSSTRNANSEILGYSLYFELPQINRIADTATNSGRSVRCVKNSR